MPHKYNTRITSGALLSKKYTRETSDSSDDSDTESSYSTNSYVSNTNISNKKNNSKKINKCDYYKFLNELYPSNYSKNKYIDEIKKTITNKESNKRLKKSDTNLFTNKIIKKSRKNHKEKVNRLNQNISSDDDDDEYDDNDDTTNFKNSKYEKQLLARGLARGFGQLFENIKCSDKNVNIILNLKKGKNNIYNNENNTSESMLTNSLF